MSLYDFFFPQQAQASHLRKLADQSQQESMATHRQRLAEAQARRMELVQTRSLEERVEQLERDLAQAGLAIEALLELLEQSGSVSREALADRIRDIDVRDGASDGRFTPPEPPPFTPKRSWPGPAR